ncbi:helix-turn-helix domain-containing protein [Streptosporangium sp. NPDC000396]|uniref:helix-turn-helix domain-containing protein n=1 Tax=Streptosporangium sp. NPDC000396 TaxID=3366185 RepID=UPI0036CF9ED8
MRRSYKFLLRPTSKQAAALAACLEDHRVLYNAALEHRRTAYRRAGGRSPPSRPPCAACRRRSPPSSPGSAPGARRGFRGSRGAAGSTR